MRNDMTYLNIPEGCTWSAQEWDKWISERVNDFYVYRVFEVKDDLFEVAVLKDPTAGSPKVIYEIDLFREPGTARYEVIEVS